VLLRVTQVATLSAPTSQIVALQESMDKLEKARRALGDRIESSAHTQIRQLHEVQGQLHALQSAPPPVPVVCPTAPPPSPKKRKPRAKAAQKPAAVTPPPAAH